MRRIRGRGHRRGADQARAEAGCCSNPILDWKAVSASQIDEYLSGIDEPKRGTLQALRGMILEIVPEAEQGISYRIPTFRVAGKVVAGFAAFKDHLSVRGCC